MADARLDIPELGILFMASMVRAILAGEKTCTRRGVKAPKGWDADEITGATPNEDGERWTFWCQPNPGFHQRPRYGPIGRRLWVRETWALVVGEDRADGTPNIVYRAHGFDSSSEDTGVDRDGSPRAVATWRPSLLMPRWASRIALVVTDIRAERLSRITPDDVRAEGFVHAGLGSTPDDYCRGYREINGLAKNADPFVWRYGFKRREWAPGEVQS